MRHTIGIKRQVHFVKQLWVRIFLFNSSVANFLKPRFSSLKNWRNGVNIKWSGAAVALMRWHESFS